MLSTSRPDLDALRTLDDKLRWLSAWTIHNANHLREPVRALGEWAIEHITCIRAAQERFDQAADRE